MGSLRITVGAEKAAILLNGDWADLAGLRRLLSTSPILSSLYLDAQETACRKRRKAQVDLSTRVLRVLIEELGADSLTELRLEGEVTESHLAPSLVYLLAGSLTSLRLHATNTPATRPNLPLWPALRPLARLQRLVICLPGLHPPIDLLLYGLVAKPQLSFLALSHLDHLPPTDLLQAIRVTGATHLGRLSIIYPRLPQLFQLFHKEENQELVKHVERLLWAIPEGMDWTVIMAALPSLRAFRVLAAGGPRETAERCGEVAGAYLRYHHKDVHPTTLTVSAELSIPFVNYRQILGLVNQRVMMVAGSSRSKGLRCALPRPCQAVFRAHKGNASAAIQGLRFH